MIEILFERGLEAQCRKLLANAKKTARVHELYPYLIELLEWEKRIIISAENVSEKNLDKILKEQKEYIKAFNIRSDYAQLNTRMEIALRNSFSKRTTDSLVEHKRFLEHPLFKSKEIPLSWIGKSQFFEIKASCYELTGDFLNSYLYRKESLLLFENSPEKKTQKLKLYLVILNKYFGILIRLKKYQEIEKYITLFTSLRTPQLNSVKIRYGVFLSYCNVLNFYLRRGEFEKGIELIKEIEPNLIKYKGKISTEIELGLYINIAIVYFAMGNFSKTLYWLNKILSDPTLSLRNEIICFARILNLIAHFEHGNIDMLEYVVKSTYRFLYKRGRLYKFETVVLNFIKNKLPTIFNNKELIVKFIELKGELDILGKDYLEEEVSESFDFISWVESKIQNRPFREVFREKVMS